MVVRDLHVQGYGKVASYAEGKLFLVEELLLVIKLVLGGPGIVRSPPRGPQGDGLMRGAAWPSWRARSFGCGCRAEAATYRFEPGGSLP